MQLEDQLVEGNKTAGLAFQVDLSPPAPATGETETWNGSSWTEVADLNTARRGEQAGSGAGSTQQVAGEW